MSEKDDSAAQEAEYRKRRNLERLEGDDAMTTWMIFAAAAVAGGDMPKKAAQTADALVAEAKKRFT